MLSPQSSVNHMHALTHPSLRCNFCSVLSLPLRACSHHHFILGGFQCQQFEHQHEWQYLFLTFLGKHKHVVLKPNIQSFLFVFGKALRFHICEVSARKYWCVFWGSSPLSCLHGHWPLRAVYSAANAEVWGIPCLIFFQLIFSKIIKSPDSEG